MTKKLLFCFSTFGLAAAMAASSYHVTLFEPSTVAGRTLKAGDYKLELTDNSVILKHNKDVTAIPARIETGTSKFNSTSVKYNDKHELEEIHLGGTNKIVVVGATPKPASNSGL